MRKGKGRYRDTHIVTFAPRYLLDNRSTHKLAFAQREFARGKVINFMGGGVYVASFGQLANQTDLRTVYLYRRNTLDHVCTTIFLAASRLSCILILVKPVFHCFHCQLTLH